VEGELNMCETERLRSYVLEISRRIYELQCDCSYDLGQLPDTHSYLKEAEILCKRNGVKFKVVAGNEKVKASLNFTKNLTPVILVEKPKSKKKEINDLAGEQAIRLFGAYLKYAEGKKQKDIILASQIIENMDSYSTIFWKGWNVGKKYMRKPKLII